MQPEALLFPVPLGFLAGLCPSMFLLAPPRPRGVGTPLPRSLFLWKLLGFLSLPSLWLWLPGTQATHYCWPQVP